MLHSMRSWLATSVLLAACGGTKPAASPPPTQPHVEPIATATAESETPVDTLGIDWATVPHATDEEALAIWAQLGLTGDNWEVRIGEIRADEEVVDAMAKAFLREGNFACPSTSPPTCDGVPYLQFQEIAPTVAFSPYADFADPTPGFRFTLDTDWLPAFAFVPQAVQVDLEVCTRYCDRVQGTTWRTRAACGDGP